MQEQKTGTREELLAACKEVHEREEEIGKLTAKVTEARRSVPWVKVDKKYSLDTERGVRTLSDLFDGRSQLMVYHMMFGTDWTAACPACTALVDHFDPMLPHLHARDVTLICVSHAPIEKLKAYRQRMGWKVDCVSSFRSDFNYDFGASVTKEQQPEVAREVLPQFEGNEEIAQAAASVGKDVAGYVTTEAPGIDVFSKEADGTIYHTFTSVPYGDQLIGYLQMLERVPRPGPEGFIFLRHDEYATAAARR
jgi:predicted dithiol-disulfide oxidoreductase (DUF899 family)